MKKLYLLMALVCTTTIYCHAQNERDAEQFGIKLGANYSTVYDAKGDSFQADPKFGFAGGIFITIPLSEIWGIQPEVLFSQKGYKGRGNLLGNPYVVTYTSNYIDVPLLVAVKPSETVSILAGPQYSFLLSHRNKFENGQTSIVQEFDNENLRKNTLCFTGGVDINLNKLVISGRVGWDLFHNNGDGTTNTPRYKNVWSQLTIGSRF